VHHAVSDLSLVDVEEAAYVSARHADAPEVCVDDAGNAEVQTGPGGCVVARPVGGVAAGTREG
jgi:hypothetical protein